jgi:hypothetical protein
MPVLLTTEHEFDTWLNGPVTDAIASQRPLPNELLRFWRREKRAIGRWFPNSAGYRLCPIHNQKPTFLEFGTTSEKRHQQKSRIDNVKTHMIGVGGSVDCGTVPKPIRDHFGASMLRLSP